MQSLLKFHEYDLTTFEESLEHKKQELDIQSLLVIQSPQIYKEIHLVVRTQLKVCGQREKDHHHASILLLQYVTTIDILIFD